MTNLPNNTPSEQPASQQASPSPSRQSLESEFDSILHRFLYTFAPDGTVKPENYITTDFPQAKAALLKTVDREVGESLKSGFYAGQAMAGVELEDCHANWKKWNSNDE